MGFEGKRALVTGAGKGIGRELVKALRDRGATVTALSRSADDLRSLQAETGCETIAADLEDTEAAAAVSGTGTGGGAASSVSVFFASRSSTRVDATTMESSGGTAREGREALWDSGVADRKSVV